MVPLLKRLLTFLLTTAGMVGLYLGVLVGTSEWMLALPLCLAAGAALILLAHRRRFAPHGALRAGSAVGFGLALFATLVVGGFDGGFDDGPYRGRPFSGDLSRLTPSDTVAYRGDVLVAYERDGEQAPVLTRQRNGKVLWAHELFASFDESSTRPSFTLLRDLDVRTGPLRDEVGFIGGGEHGHLRLWRFGGVQKFYYSW